MKSFLCFFCIFSLSAPLLVFGRGSGENKPDSNNAVAASIDNALFAYKNGNSLMIDIFKDDKNKTKYENGDILSLTVQSVSLNNKTGYQIGIIGRNVLLFTNKNFIKLKSPLM